MRKLIYILIFIFTLFSLHASAGMPESYSSQQVITSNGFTLTNTVHADKGKMRIETDMGGMKTTTLVRPDKNATYQILPGNIYMELPINNLKDMMTGYADKVDLAYVDVGTETINGIACKKQKATVDGKEFFLWITSDTNMPVKMQTADNTVMVEWKNMQTGPQDAALFELPAGAAKANMGAFQDPQFMQTMMNSISRNGGPSFPGGVNPVQIPSVPGVPTAPPPQNP